MAHRRMHSFTKSSRWQDRQALFVMTHGGLSRRAALHLAALTALSVCTRPDNAYALKPGKPSKETLLNRVREERTPEEIEAEKIRVQEERRIRLEKQRELQAAAERKRAGLEVDKDSSTEIEANLRANYYYPTARKRYLPRVKRALEEMEFAEDALRNDKWQLATSIAAGPLEDAVLPMRLYASSLAGQGLSLAAKFVQNMADESDKYERALSRFKKACKKRDTNTALSSLVAMKESIKQYRHQAHLEAPDFGIGDLPKENRVGSGLANNNPALYNRNFHEILNATN